MNGMRVQTSWNRFYIEVEAFNNGEINIDPKTLTSQIHLVSKGIKSDTVKGVCQEFYQRLMTFLSFDISQYCVTVELNGQSYSLYSWKW
jgi:hypothetical protein